MVLKSRAKKMKVSLSKRPTWRKDWTGKCDWVRRIDIV